MILYVILGVVLALVILLGALIGLKRGYVKVQTWAGEYVVAALLTIAISALLNGVGVPAIISGAITIICAVLLLIGCIVLSKILKSIIQKSLERRDRQFLKHGAVGVINRVFGAIALAIKALTIAMLIVMPVLIVLDFAQIGVVEGFLSGVYQSAFWYALKPIAFDLIVIGVISLAIRHGFSKGIFTSLWSLFVFALIVGAGFLCYHLVFGTSLFSNASAALANKISGWFGNVEMLSNLAGTLAKWFIIVGMFILLLIVILVTSLFMSRVISFSRLSDGFYIADGILGASVAVIIAIVVMLFLGYLIQPLFGMEFMQPFDSYIQVSSVAKYFYGNNLLTEVGIPFLLPLNEWLS